MLRDCKDGEFILMGTKWNNLCISKNKGGLGLQELNLFNLAMLAKSISIRDAKKLYFTPSKPTLSIIPSHFTTHLTSQFLFLHTTH